MIPVAPFGRTGHDSTRLIFGAAALGRMSQERADATLAVVEQAGINHIDTAAGYGDSELRLAPWLQTHRADVFLATKTGDRTGDEARASLERSLERLGVDHVDLIQLHNLVEEDEWETAHAPGGAVSAMAQARDEGLTRFIGVTGHGLRIPGMHVRSLERFPFDSVLVPLNHSLRQLDGYRADLDRLLELCADRGVAVQTIKSLARHRWDPASQEPHFSWYQPLTDEQAIARAVGYVLAHAGVFLNTSSDARLLPPAIAALEALRTPTDAEMRADQAAFDITPLFDGDALERI